MLTLFPKCETLTSVVEYALDLCLNFLVNFSVVFKVVEENKKESDDDECGYNSNFGNIIKRSPIEHGRL